MKRFSVALIIILSLFVLTSCETLGLGEFFDIKSWDWNIFDTETINEKVEKPVKEETVKTEQVSNPVVTTIKEDVPGKTEKIVEKIDEKPSVPVVEFPETVREIIDTAKEKTEVPEDVETSNVVDEISAWFDIKEEVVEEKLSEVEDSVVEVVQSVTEQTKDVVETTAESLETAVSDVLSAINNSKKEQTSNPVIVVPSKENSETATDNKSVVQKQEESEKPVVQSATELANATLPQNEEVDSIGSSAVLVIILIAAGLIGIAIAYYCISIKKKSY